jgi:hypothetical protein
VSVSASTVAHHLRLFGIEAVDMFSGSISRRTIVCTDSSDNDVIDAVRPFRYDGSVVLLRPSRNVLTYLGMKLIDTLPAPQIVHFPGMQGKNWEKIRSLHDVDIYTCDRPHDVVAADANGRPCWLWLHVGNGGILVLGTNLGGDLIRYRQGDPCAAVNRPRKALWGVAGERPNYLFEPQTPSGSEYDRPADWWAMALAETVSQCLGEPLKPMLPHSAPGAVVITGDDDQAFLNKYEEQLALLDGLPITYFLHPRTRHTANTLAQMLRRHKVELALHPDALDQPDQYAELLREQVEWFHDLTGRNTRSVRNHGFLNNGYWGHLPLWLEHGIEISSNLPGLDGKILNGSMLPARVSSNGILTSHWSILTAIGDGVRFALEMDGPQSAQCIMNLADRVKSSKLPGVIVLNLHPQNVAETREMHTTLHELVHEGFLPMTMEGCIDWFAARDTGKALEVRKSPLDILRSTFCKFVGDRWKRL